MSGVEVRVEGLTEVQILFVAAASKALPEAKGVVGRGAFQIKKDWRQRWSGHVHIPVLPYAIGYDTTVRAGTVESEIGPDQGTPQGPLAGIIAWGSPTSAPLPGPLEAIAAEEPRFVAAMHAMAAKLLDA